MAQGGEATLDRAATLGFDLRDREVAVLAELAREGEARVAFQGLRRRLDVHQQILTRTLRRLEGDGLVEHDPRGYRLTERGFAAVRGGGPSRAQPRETLTVVQAMLPPHLDAESVAGHLAHRWFQGLRWYGQADGPGESTLTWLAEPGRGAVRVRVAGGTLALEVEAAAGGQAPSFAAARGVLAAVAELYGLEPDAAGPGAAFAAEPGVAA